MRAWIQGLAALVLATMAGAGMAHAQNPTQSQTSPEVRQALALVDADPAQARTILQPAAEAGDVDAMYTLAAMLATGLGGEPDGENAREWYYQAALQGSARATRALGMMVFTGEGGEAQPAFGIALLQLAAEAGDQNAADLLSMIPDDAAELEDVSDARAAWLADHDPPDAVN